MEAVSQLDRDASTALATIREWRNSFVHVNHIPADVLSLIPTHLPTQKDRFRAASVGRHWRGVLLRDGALWSQLFLKKGEECVSTLLERAKGSALEVITDCDAPVGTTALIAPRAQQIVYLEFMQNHWQDIITFSEFNSGQLPLLHTLKIAALETPVSLVDVTPPSLPFFRGSINLEEFVLRSWRLSLLSHFVFPNLTTFKLLSNPGETCTALGLLNFLEASPMLGTIEIYILEVVMASVPEELVVTLPNVKSLSLQISTGTVPLVYDLAAHISCPHARCIYLTHDMYDEEMSAGLELFPTFVSWNTIIHQYTASPIKEVTLKVKRSEGVNIECFLTFRSSDAIVVRLGLIVGETGIDDDDLNMSLAEIGWVIFSQALKTISNHPLLSHVKHLHIKYKAAMSNTRKMPQMANKFRELFVALGPLDELILHGCDLHLFLANFLDNLGLGHLVEPVVFPQIKELMILHPSMEVDEVECMNAIVELAKSQRALGIPFESVTVHTWKLPTGMAEELERWVDEVDCCGWCRDEEEEEEGEEDA